MSKHLFSDFSPVSSKAWKQKIQVDLKGADYNDTLLWQSLEGIKVKPFYHNDQLKTTTSLPDQPSAWNVGQAFYIDDEVIVNKLALDALHRGAEALFFNCDAPFDVEVLCNNFPFDTCIYYFQFQFLDPSFVKSLQHYLVAQKATGYVLIDTIANVARTGNWFENEQIDIEKQLALLQQHPQIPSLAIDVSLYQQAGATMVQQLAYAMAHTVEYFQRTHPSQNQKNQQVLFKVSVGSHYFFEIAKLRALRILFATLANEFGFSATCHIIATPSKRNKTVYDYNANMLRTTTESMSAILGGADTVCNLAYDAVFHKSNEFGERIARNQLLILKAESYFDSVSNPADGSYYIENITQELAEKALELCKNIEANGGFLNQLKEGTIQRKIKESASKEQQLFDEGVIKLVGTNMQPNPNDIMKENLELYPFIKQKNHKTSLIPIIEKRIAETLEKERLKNEK